MRIPVNFALLQQAVMIPGANVTESHINNSKSGLRNAKFFFDTDLHGLIIEVNGVNAFIPAPNVAVAVFSEMPAVPAAKK